MGLLNLRRRPAAVVEMSERDRRLIWRIAALVLDYPKPDTLGMLDELTAAAGTVPEPAREHLTELLAHLSGTDPLESARAYVETFDLRRRASLHLTYYAYGDTRKRGMALLRFKHAYRHAQVELSDRELPDHLPVLLEFAATCDPIGGERLLGEHVPVLEMLRLSLTDSGSPYADALAAVLCTLAPPTTADRRRIAELAAQGPPEEDVGLEPYSMDTMHPAMNPDLYTAPEASATTGLFAGSGDR